jgi:hypothetical protein
MSDIDPEKLEEAVRHYEGFVGPKMRIVVDAARAHLATLPRWKEVDVWRVEYAEATPEGWSLACETHESADEAEINAGNFRLSAPVYDCIRVTGPHKQRVPQ